MTTTVTSTIKSAGGDYSTLTAWEAAKQANITAATGSDQIQQAECYAFSCSDSLTIDGWVTSSGNYIRIYTPTAQRHNGTSRDVSGTGFQISNGAEIITNQEDFFYLEGIELKVTGSTANIFLNGSDGTLSATNQLAVDSCIFIKTAGTNFGCSIQNSSTQKGYMRNSIIITTGSAWAMNSIGTFEVSNCTIWHRGAPASTGITYTGNNATIQNTFVGGFTTCFSQASGTPAKYQRNASTDATGDDDDATTSLINVTATAQFTSLTSGSENFNLVAGSVLIDAGTALAVLTTDIVGTTRS